MNKIKLDPREKRALKKRISRFFACAFADFGAFICGTELLAFFYEAK